MRESWSIVLGHMRQKNPYKVAVAVVLTVAIIAVLLFFFSPVKAVDVVLQDLPTTYGYVAPPPVPPPPVNWWLIGGIVSAVVTVVVVIWMTLIGGRVR